MPIFDWLQQNKEVLGWLGAVSVFTFFGTLAAVPAFLIWLPADYLAEDPRPLSAAWPRPLRWIFRIGRNLIAGVLLVAGLAMLVLPGQGLLTLFVALLLADIPGKQRMIRKLLLRRSVFGRVNRLREKAGRPPLSAS